MAYIQKEMYNNYLQNTERCENKLYDKKWYRALYPNLKYTHRKGQQSLSKSPVTEHCDIVANKGARVLWRKK